MSTTLGDPVVINATTNITSTSATALTVAASGSNYGLQIDESTASAATGVKIIGKAAGSGVGVSAISSGTDEALTIDAKGSGKITVGGTSTGTVALATGGGDVGIGTSTPLAFTQLDIVRTFTDSTTANTRQVRAELTVAPSASTTGERVGVLVDVIIPNTNSNDLGRVGGLVAGARNLGSGDMTNLIAIQGNALSLAGVASSVDGGLFTGEIEDGTAAAVSGLNAETSVVDSTVTDIYGLYVGSQIGGTATVTNRYGIQIDAPTGSTTGDDFGLYVNANVPNYFAGRIGIGTTTPGYPLDVNGEIKATRIGLGQNPDGSYSLRAAGAIRGTEMMGNSVQTVNSGGTGTIKLDLDSPSGQTANLMQWRVNSGTPLGVVTASGAVGIGTASPATSAALEVASTTGAVLLPRMTSTERDALTAVNGMLIYNTTTNKFQGYENGAWVNLV